ncbi:MAG: DNA polymerase IV [Candidatus Promineifilaceae bacterium]
MSDAQPATGAWPRAVLHLDMDAFFVNVHLLEHPEDRGIPLAVGGRAEQRGVIASASYEARRFGVRSAMPTSMALRLCPRLKIVGHARTSIRGCSRKVMGILAEYGPLEKTSVDEAYLELSGRADPEALAAAIQARVKAESGLPCSVGLAANKLVAKVASDHDKPEGCTVVRPGEEAAFLAPLPVRALHGIGPSTAAKLAELGIKTCGQLAAAEPAGLRGRFGRYADELQQRAQGVDARPVQPEHGPPKSISEERTFERDRSDAAFLNGCLHEMAAGVAAELRRRGLLAHTVKIKLRWADFTTFTRQKSLAAGTDEAELIGRLSVALLTEHWSASDNLPLRLLGVSASGLAPATARQPRLPYGP